MKRQIRISIVLIPLFLHFISFAQDEKLIDSLKRALTGNKLNERQRAAANADLAWHISYYNLSEGLPYAEKAIELSEKLHDYKLISHALHVSASIYMDIGDYPKAIDRFIRSMNYADSTQDYKAKAISAGNLGIVYAKRNEFRKSVETYMMALRIFEKEKNKGALSVYLNLSASYEALGIYDSAKYYCEKTLNGFEGAPPDSMLKSSAYGNLGSIYTDLKDYKTAEKYILHAIRCLPDTSQHYYYQEHYLSLGSILLKQNQPDAALAPIMKSLTYSREVGTRENEKTCYELLAEAYQAKNNPTRALEYFKLYSKLKDTLFNQEQEKQVKFAEAQFQSAQQEKEIALLNQDKKLQDEKLEKKNILINTFLFGGIILVLALASTAYAFANKRKANRKLQSLNNEIRLQKNLLQEKNREVTDSIYYARRIQQSLFTSVKYIEKNLGRLKEKGNRN
jgi:tetratricopeptide (TPR) repeat protein